MRHRINRRVTTSAPQGRLGGGDAGATAGMGKSQWRSTQGHHRCDQSRRRSLARNGGGRALTRHGTGQRPTHRRGRGARARPRPHSLRVACRAVRNSGIDRVDCQPHRFGGRDGDGRARDLAGADQRQLLGLTLCRTFCGGGAGGGVRRAPRRNSRGGRPRDCRGGGAPRRVGRRRAGQ